MFVRLAPHPWRWRWTPMVHHLEMYGLRSVPIIMLINFLVGAIVTQQGIFQLNSFGASAYAVNLVGVLGLRELGVLMTSIMIAGRTGSSITAEIGSMKMREEIDALKVMALDPLEVLIIPRLVALIIALPLLTFLADLAQIAGGLLVELDYAGLTPAASSHPPAQRGAAIVERDQAFCVGEDDGFRRARKADSQGEERTEYILGIRASRVARLISVLCYRWCNRRQSVPVPSSPL